MIIRIAQEFFCRLQDKNRLVNTKIGQKRTTNEREPTEIRQEIGTANGHEEESPTADERRLTEIEEARIDPPSPSGLDRARRMPYGAAGYEEARV
jgi:hypothetical protein